MKPVKAYEVQEGYEGHGCVVFATNSATARREGADELMTDWESVDSCKRAPWADQYAPGPVPISAFLTQGWWFECGHCGCTFEKDGRRDGDHDREDECDPVKSQGTTFCSPTCSSESWAQTRARQAAQNAAIEACAIKWPQATGITASERCSGPLGRDTRWSAFFFFPGGQYSVEWPIGGDTALVSQADVEAFKAWQDSLK